MFLHFFFLFFFFFFQLKCTDIFLNPRIYFLILTCKHVVGTHLKHLAIAFPMKSHRMSKA